MVNFRDVSEVERWLELRPKDVVVVLAARTALRVAPLMVKALSLHAGNPEVRGSIVLPWFYAIATPWGATADLSEISAYRGARAADKVVGSILSHERDNRAAYAAADIASAAARAAARAAAALDATAAIAAAYTADAVADATYAAAAAGGADVVVFEALSADATALELGVASEELAIRKLWPGRRPQWAGDNWSRLKKALRAFPKEENWSVWEEWYEARLRGGGINHELESDRLDIASGFWERGPQATNTRIARLLEETQKESESPRQEVDLFISYSEAESSYAKWVSALLINAGFTVFPSLPDDPAGDDIRSIRYGPIVASRMIALLSPAYVRSDECQRQWKTAFESDPSETKRELISLLVRPTQLNDSNQKIVVHQVIGLSAVDVAKVILDAVGFERPRAVVVPQNYPGALAVDEVNITTGGVFQVGPSASGLLERKPIPPSNSDEAAGFAPDRLYAAMASEIGGFCRHIQKASGNFSCSSRLKDRATRLLNSFDVDFSRCDPLELHKNLTWVLRVIALDKKDGNIPPNDEIEYYVSDLYGYYQRLEFIFPQLKKYRNMEAFTRFVAPDEYTEKAIREVYVSLGSHHIAKDALSLELSDEFQRAGDDIAAAKFTSETDFGDEATYVSAEAHTEGATKSMGVWSWLANGREKFEKAGRKASEIDKTLEGYEKLYKRLSPHMAEYIAYLLKWFL